MSEPGDTAEAVEAIRNELVNGLFEYVRIGYDRRTVAFSEDGRISRGGARCETYWSVRILDGRVALEIFDEQRELICRLSRTEAGGWSGRWAKFEMMPIRLAPLRPARPRAVVIQQADGEFRDLLRLTYAHHADYAERHGLDFWCLLGETQVERDSVWTKVFLIRQALDLNYQLVVWLDADSLIVRPDCDVRQALAEFTCVGMCKHPLAWRGQAWHFNAGVIFVRNCPTAHDFFSAVWDVGPTPHPWKEQARILEYASVAPGAVQPIDDRWNSTDGINPSPEPVIKAWHGCGSAAIRRGFMAAELIRVARKQR